MKAFLLYRDRDFDPKREPPRNADALTQDLDLNTLLDAMAHGDPFLRDIARSALLTSLTDLEAITYRQRTLEDCLMQPATVRRLYDLAVDALQVQRKVWGLWGSTPDAILYRSVKFLELLVESLKTLRALATEVASEFQSEAFTRLFAMLQSELDDAYFQEVAAHLRELKFPRGVLLSAELGAGAKGANYVLRRPPAPRWTERILSTGRSSYSFRIAERDEAGFKALETMRGRGINLVANALAQSTDHILNFFTVLRTELAFYVGCLNLRERLLEYGEPFCLPTPLVLEQRALTARGLYDPCLALHRQDGSARVVGNDLGADGRTLLFITGANQGGKSSFLRAVGLAQLMAQCGMFVAAESFRVSICHGLFTHFKREEDASMTSGKLDEELRRMSDIASSITPHALLLCNESFASTNEREGSEIARQVVRALTESGVRVIFVTHLFDLAYSFSAQHFKSALFLRAERLADGERTYRIVEGEPLPTSHGEDTYQRVFGSAADA